MYIRLSLEKMLFDQRTQQEVLCAVANDLDALSEVENTDWLGNPLKEVQTLRRKPIQWSLPDVISADIRETRTPGRDGDLKEIGTSLRAVAENGSGLQCVFFVLLCFLLCDNLLNFISAGSPAELCKAYFSGFEQRIVEGLCGRMGYSNDRSGRVLVAAKPPCEIAINELLLATQLITAHNAKGALGRRSF